MAEERSNAPSMQELLNARTFPATVAKVLDEYTVVINRGSDDGIKQGQTFLIFSTGDEVVDPESKESLGLLELVRGRGSVTHVQPKMATIRSSKKRPPKSTTTRNLGLLSMGTEVIEQFDSGDVLPFDGPEVGNKAKPV